MGAAEKSWIGLPVEEKSPRSDTIVTDLDTPSRKSSTKHQRYPLQDNSQFTQKRRPWHGGVPCPDDWPQRLVPSKGYFLVLCDSLHHLYLLAGSKADSKDSNIGHHTHTSLGAFLESKPELDNASSMEDRGILEDIGAEVIHTLRAASYKLFRFHLHDWLALIALAVIYGILNIIDPFYRYVGKQFIQDYMYPLKSNTIPFQAVPVCFKLLQYDIFIDC
ncbi:hypothetical protein L7F22_011497 [Adiantum nelumboides]|nr:hypothetical protein [Adiantum nelumboides]